MKRTDAARAGAEKLMRAEAAIDAALRETAELMGLLPSLRLEARLSAVIGQAAVANLGETLSHIVSARRTIIEAHSALSTVRTQIGCGAMAIGDMDKPGDPPRTSGLRAVDGGARRVSTAQTAQTDSMHDELNEFRRHLRTLGPVQRRILQVLMPQLIALEEAGDADGALTIIEEVKAILWEGRRTRH